MITIHTVVLCGRVSDVGPMPAYTSKDIPQCSLKRKLSEFGKDDTMFKLFVVIDVFGRQAMSLADTITVRGTVLVYSKRQRIMCCVGAASGR
jgi:hypothetical protein